MASVANISSTIQHVPLPVNIQEGTAFLFYSVFLRAVIFIATNGELRVTTPCLSEHVTKDDVTMMKVCNRGAAGNRLCLYASKDGRHFLAASRDTGRLVTISDNCARAMLNSSKTSPYCLHFEEVDSNATGRLNITACPSSSGHTISFDRLHIRRNADCELARQQVFTQSVRNSTTSTRRHKVASLLEYYAKSVECPRRSRSVWMRCRNHMQDSYPLLWKNCA